MRAMSEWLCESVWESVGEWESALFADVVSDGEVRQQKATVATSVYREAVVRAYTDWRHREGVAVGLAGSRALPLLVRQRAVLHHVPHVAAEVDPEAVVHLARLRVSATLVVGLAVAEADGAGQSVEATGE